MRKGGKDALVKRLVGKREVRLGEVHKSAKGAGASSRVVQLACHAVRPLLPLALASFGTR